MGMSRTTIVDQISAVIRGVAASLLRTFLLQGRASSHTRRGISAFWVTYLQLLERATDTSTNFLTTSER